MLTFQELIKSFLNRFLIFNCFLAWTARHCCDYGLESGCFNLTVSFRDLFHFATCFISRPPTLIEEGQYCKPQGKPAVMGLLWALQIWNLRPLQSMIQPSGITNLSVQLGAAGQIFSFGIIYGGSRREGAHSTMVTNSFWPGVCGKLRVHCCVNNRAWWPNPSQSKTGFRYVV